MSIIMGPKSIPREYRRGIEPTRRGLGTSEADALLIEPDEIIFDHYLFIYF